jgi:hypothetical protein
MESERKKDALTELVDIAGSQSGDQEPNNGTVSTPAGEKVELDFSNLIKKIARGMLEKINLNKIRKQQEREVLEQIIKKDYERKKTK